MSPHRGVVERLSKTVLESHRRFEIKSKTKPLSGAYPTARFFCAGFQDLLDGFRDNPPLCHDVHLYAVVHGV